MKDKIEFVLVWVVFISIVVVSNIYIHEYIHYLQGECNDNFLNRMHWGETRGENCKNFLNEAVAYINVDGCPNPKNLSEQEPFTFNLVYSAISGCIFGFCPEHFQGLIDSKVGSSAKYNERQRILKIIEEMDNRGPDDIIFKKRFIEKIEGDLEND